MCRALRWFVSVLLLAGLLSGCGLMSREAPKVAALTMTDKVHEKTMAPLNPLESFPGGTKSLYAAAQVTNARKGTRVGSQWFYDKQGDGNYFMVNTAEISFDGDARQRYVSFNLTAADGFPAGDYKVQILLDGKMVTEKTFTVQAAP